jgi:WD40 repeat protein/serine/threonine protein kinase/Flp pilus assembly protein TadD
LSSTPRPATDISDPALADLLDELTARLQAGERLDEAEILRLHPNHAEQLRGLFPALRLLVDLSDSEPDSLRGLLGPIDGKDGTLGDYRILREVGRGGMGVVYEAEQISLGRRVALKVLPMAATMDPRHLQRFQNEARAVASLHHEHIVPVHAIGCERGLHYYAMQFIDGRTLAQTIVDLSSDGTNPDGSGAPLAAETSALARVSTHLTGQSLNRVRRAAELGVQAAETLEHAHALGIVHRDVKPGNLMIDGQGKLWVTDFGLARTASEHDLTMTGDVLGTLRYMSPEQALAKHGLVDHRTDIYSLGVTLYELLTLQPAVQGRDREEILRKIAFEEPPLPRQFNPAIPRELETVILKAITKEPSLRYQSAEELADDLRRFLSDQPVRARRTTTWQLLFRWRRRNPGVSAALAALAFVVVAGYALVAWGWQKEREARGKAQVAEANANDRAEQLKRSLYFQSIARADQEWWNNNVGRADQVLERCPPELRHWEWGYLKRLCHSEFQTLSGHEGEVMAVCFSPDGQTVASGSRDGTIRIWDLLEGKEILCLRGHSGDVLNVAFSPDGRRLASSSGDWAKGINGEVRIWDSATGQLVADFPQMKTMVASLAWSPDSRLLALAKFNGLVQLLDVEQRTERDFRGHTDSVKSVAFSPDGRTLASGSRDRTIRLWDIAIGVTTRTLTGHAGDVLCLAFNPSGSVLVSGGWDSTVRVWEVASGNLQRTLTAHQEIVTGAAYCPNGSEFATSSVDGTVRIWESNSWKELAALRGHNREVRSVAYSPGGTTLASVGWDRTIKIWDRTHGQQGQTFLMPLGQRRRIAYLPNGSRFVVASKSVLSQAFPGRLTVHDSRSGAEVAVLAERPDSFNCVAASPQSDLVASNWGSQIRIWNAQSGELLRTFAGHLGATNAIAFLANKSLIASGGEDGSVRLWSMDSGEPVAEYAADIGSIRTLAVSENDRWLAAAGKSGQIAIWDLRTSPANPVVRTFEGHRNEVSALVFQPLGSRLASASDDGTVRLWDPEGRAEPVELRGHVGAVTCLGFSSDGKRLASGGQDGAAVVWDVRDGQEALTLRRQLRGVSGVAFSPDGRVLAAVGNDYLEGKLWESSELSRDRSDQKLSWHLAEAEGAEAIRNQSAALFHLKCLVRLAPNNATYLTRRANQYACGGRWDAAIGDLARARELQPNSCDVWYQSAIAQLGSSDEDGFRRLMTEMVAHFGSTKSSGEASIMLYVAVLQPEPPAEPEALLALAELAAKSFAGNERILGATRYRVGQYAEALKAFEQASRQYGPRAWDWCFRAMCRQRLGQLVEAKADLKRAADWVAEADRHPPGTQMRSDVRWFHWQERVEVHRLLHEAETVLEISR